MAIFFISYLEEKEDFVFMDLTEIHIIKGLDYYYYSVVLFRTQEMNIAQCSFTVYMCI